MMTYDILNGVFEVDLEKGEFHNNYSIVLKKKQLVEQEAEEVYTKLNVYFIENNATLSISKPEELKIRKISVYNTIGQEVKVWFINNSEHEINLPVNVSTGVYLVVLETNEGSITKKILMNN